ncbi:MAG: hypothetical protein K2X81_24835, partial [Candidatus Obscuribacterales bacterium]|nr:hypothetical protein [Candidatus Obscuribacterales bacterium]
MSRFAKLALLVALVTFVANPAIADTNSDLNNLLEQASKENGDGNFNDAETHYKQALMLSVGKLGGMSNSTGKTCRQIADFYMNNNRFNDADHFLRRSLVIAAGYNGAEMDTAGEFQNTRGFVSDSIQNPGRLAGNLDVASTLSSMGTLYSRMG